MKHRFLFATLVLIAVPCAIPAAASDNQSLRVPKSIGAGETLSIQTDGSGKAVLYIVGPGQVFRRSVQRGEPVVFGAGDLHNAGRYIVCLVGPDSDSHATAERAEFDVLPATTPASLSFLAKPSRLAVNQPGGISGVVYVFDIFKNLIQQPMSVTFQLSETTGAPQTARATTQNGVAWVKMSSASKSGGAQFQVVAGGIADKRAIQQVPGEPCQLRMKAQRTGQRLVLETDPVHDCAGNAVSDGTIITFTEARNGRTEATVDVPLKRGVARAQLPALDGAVISVATGVAMGNEIRVGNRP